MDQLFCFYTNELLWNSLFVFIQKRLWISAVFCITNDVIDQLMSSYTNIILDQLLFTAGVLHLHHNQGRCGGVDKQKLCQGRCGGVHEQKLCAKRCWPVGHLVAGARTRYQLTSAARLLNQLIVETGLLMVHLWVIPAPLEYHILDPRKIQQNKKIKKFEQVVLTSEI